MSSEKPLGFDPNLTYTVDEFVSVLKELGATHPDDAELQHHIELNLDWAKKHDQNIHLITWQARSDGGLKPVATSKAGFGFI